MGRTLRSSLGLGVVLAAVGVFAPGAAPVALADPIEGTWQWSGGEILVAKAGSGYVGTVQKSPAECGHPAPSG